jgi:hypothetical protein
MEIVIKKVHTIEKHELGKGSTLWLDDPDKKMSEGEVPVCVYVSQEFCLYPQPNGSVIIQQ